MKIGEVRMAVEDGGEDCLRLRLVVGVEVLCGCLGTLECAADFGPHRRWCGAVGVYGGVWVAHGRVAVGVRVLVSCGAL